MKFTRGMMVEIDETAVRAERVKCSPNCKLCKAPCAGYRLQWNRWIMLIRRGDRSSMVVLQLPFATSEAGGGGVPLSQQECDDSVPKYLQKGVLVFTDGAAPYEALAAGDVKCSPSCSRKDCLDRARSLGKDACSGWRPRVGRESFARIYRRKMLSHGVVTHSKEEWCVVNSVRVHSANGTSRAVKLKHGTECVDGCWSEMKQSIPQSLKSVEHDKIALYVNSWAWRTWHQGEDLLRTFARSVK